MTNGVGMTCYTSLMMSFDNNQITDNVQQR